MIIVIIIFLSIYVVRLKSVIKNFEIILNNPLENKKLLFEAYLFKYNLTDSTRTSELEEQFDKNIEFINQFNNNNDDTLGITEFTSYSDDELRYLFLPNMNFSNYVQDEEDKKENIRLLQAGSIYLNKERVDQDWMGLFKYARNQMQCGSCWAFAVTAAYEGNWYLKYPNKEKVYLSNQQLLDCDLKNAGCNGGNPMSARKYVKEFGLISEQTYSFAN